MITRALVVIQGTKTGMEGVYVFALHQGICYKCQYRL